MPILYHDARAETEPPRVLVVVLPEGSPEREALSETILGAVETAGLAAVGAAEVRFASPDEVAAEVARLEETARQRELGLDLRAALEARHAVVSALEATASPVVEPARVAAALARAAATELASGSRAEAVRTWRRALGFDATLNLDATFSPSVREVFDEARRAGGTLPPRPDRRVLDRLCETGGLAAVLWVAAARDEGGPALVRLLHVPGESGFGEVRHALPEDGGARDRLLAAIRDRLEGELLPLSPERPGEDDGTPPPPPPVWRRWWLWTVVGAVVAGAAIATGLTLGLGEEHVEVRIRFP